MAKQKVLFVATVVKTHINTFHLPYLQWFQQEGYETHVVAKNDFEDEVCHIPYCDVYYDTPFDRFPLRWGNIKAYRQLKRTMKENHYAIIHCHTPVGAMIGRLAARKTRQKGTKILYTAHGFHFYKGAPLINWLLYYPVEKLCSYFTDVLITITKEDYALARRHLKAKQIEYVPGVGIDIEKVNRIRVDKKEKREQLGIDEGALMLLSVGELNKNKNHAVVIQALSQVTDTTIHYCIAGSGPLEKELQALIDTYHMKERVHLLGYRADIYELCQIADVFVFPSFREGISVALMEAMATGLPVIGSRIRGNVDWVEEGKGGILCRPDSVEDFVKSINMMCAHQETLKRMGQYNKEVIRNLDLNRIKEQMKQIYVQ